MQANKQYQQNIDELQSAKQQIKPQHLLQQQQQHQQHQQHQQQQQITAQTIQSFNRVCQNAAILMQSYKQQSCALKEQISSMVSIYKKSSSSTTQSIPVDKIIQITKQYQIGMRQANNQYNSLNEELRKQERERDDMMKQIEDMFGKLEKMEVKLKEKRMKDLERKKNEEENQNKQQVEKKNIESMEKKINQLNLKQQDKKQ